MTTDHRAPASGRGPDDVRARLTEVVARSRELGYLGPGPVEPQIEHALAFTAAVDEAPATALDLGAGGGLPGLVLACLAWPSTRWVLLDAQRKRTTFLREAVAELGLADRVTVVTERAEVVGRQVEHRGAYDLVTARSFGPPAVTAECAAPLLCVGGHLVVSEPPTGSRGRWPTEALAQLGFGPAAPLIQVGAHLVVCRLDQPVPDRYPRRVGQPAKRPIF